MRSTAAERRKSSIVAEREIMRFAVPDPETGIRPHALWHKHIHNVELDPMQVLKMHEMDLHPPYIPSWMLRRHQCNPGERKCLITSLKR